MSDELREACGLTKEFLRELGFKPGEMGCWRLPLKNSRNQLEIEDDWSVGICDEDCCGLLDLGLTLTNHHQLRTLLAAIQGEGI